MKHDRTYYDGKSLSVKILLRGLPAVAAASVLTALYAANADVFAAAAVPGMLEHVLMSLLLLVAGAALTACSAR